MKFAIQLFFLLFVALTTATANAASKSYVLSPFTVNAPQSYAYLSKAVPASIQAKINRPGAMEGRTSQTKAASQAEARKILSASNADFAIWGSVSVTGNECTIELNSVDKAGNIWSKSGQGSLSSLNTTVQKLSAALGSEVLGLSGVGTMRTPGGARQAGSSSSDILVNETGQQQTYLNPQFRYQGAGAGDGSRLRSQRLKEGMVDMAVGDFNGDGKNEIAILHEHKLTIYVWGDDGRLKQLGETTVSRSNLNFSMRAIDLDRDGARDLVIATYEEESNRPYSYFYSFKGNKLTQAAERSPYFASVLNLPPNNTPTLVGQGWDSLKLFAPGVRLMVREGNKYGLGSRVDLPPESNVFNVAWLPGGKNSPSQIVMLTDVERLKLFQGAGHALVHSTMEQFSGSATGMDHYKSMPGLGINRVSQMPGKYYAPMRMIAADIGRTGEYVLIVNKPISTASQLFDRYRYFPQGEVHALYWDGVGLGLKWKTRRVRGSVAEIDLADVNNDGILDLVVGLNTSPELGIGSRQCMITAYPLDVSRTDPNTPADLSDFEVTPNQ
ncbi:MAG: VCBS repeat-containing protein [Desulfovibrio sp.]|jgi:hypothetical protein|nr:VCBS repeat-containing protein [Desulfovibrio sp.]